MLAIASRLIKAEPVCPDAVASMFDLVDYWKAHGWPDLCRPVGSDDFVCD